MTGNVEGPVGIVVFGAKRMKNGTAFVYADSQLDLKDKEWKEKDSVGMISKTGAVYIGRLHGNKVSENSPRFSISIDSDSSGSRDVPKGYVDKGNIIPPLIDANDILSGTPALDFSNSITVESDSNNKTHVNKSHHKSTSKDNRIHSNYDSNGNSVLKASTAINDISGDSKLRFRDDFQFSGPVATAVDSTGPEKLIHVTVVIATSAVDGGTPSSSICMTASSSSISARNGSNTAEGKTNRLYPNIW